MSQSQDRNPEQYHVAKDFTASGAKLPPGHHPRPWFCRTCGVEGPCGPNVPEGWYSLTRHTADVKRPLIRLGVYCSVACIAGQVPRLHSIERDVPLSRVVRSEFVQTKDEGYVRG
jgi:hypothetical protein